ncbi:hypothetical protein B9S64_24695 [Streptomyces sp. SM18]|nr:MULTISPECIES: hypothetical protein [unclassified Streptomyces]AWL40940.1 hypothetical protein B9S64_24695 [Streptomyces sp. SM18]
MVRRRVPAVVLGGVWWWAVLRLALEPDHAGLVEGAVAAGGWGLSLLPVHVAATVGPADDGAPVGDRQPADEEAPVEGGGAPVEGGGEWPAAGGGAAREPEAERSTRGGTVP